MSNVKVVEPIEGLAFLSLRTMDGNMVDIPLSYLQDITGPFIKEFKLYLTGAKNDGHMVLAVSGEEGKFLVISDEEKSYVINEATEELTVCPATAKDIIKACIRNFVDYLDTWANFDIKDEPGNSVSYTRDFADRKGLIESAEDEINPFLIPKK